MNGIGNKINGTENKMKGLFRAETFQEFRFVPARNRNNAAIAHDKNAAFTFLVSFYFVKINHVGFMNTEEDLFIKLFKNELQMVGAHVLLLVFRMYDRQATLRFEPENIGHGNGVNFFIIRNDNVSFHNRGVKKDVGVNLFVIR